MIRSAHHPPHSPTTIHPNMDFFNRKPKSKSPSSACGSFQFTANISIFLLLFYLIFAVHRLHAGRCALPTVNSEGHSTDPTTTFPSATQARFDRPYPPCTSHAPRAKSFLMVFMGHSGSTALLSELGQHPLIHLEKSELVDHQRVFNSTDALIATRDFFSRGIRMGKIPGFKIRPAHILENPEAWRAIIKSFGTRIISNYRQNVFKQTVGQYALDFFHDNSSVQGLFEKMTREERCNKGIGCRYPITDHAFFAFRLGGAIKNQQYIFSALRALFPGKNPCIREVPYEDYLYHREKVLPDLFKFLGIPPAKSEPLRYKATNDNVCKVVTNWNDLCESFYGCLLLKPMMDDERNGCYCNLKTPDVKYCSFPSVT